MAAYVISTHRISISRACKVVNLPKSMYCYRNKKDDSETIAKLRVLADRYPTEGQDLYYSRIRHEGLKWNYKRIRRVYQLLGMNRRRKTRRRLPARVKQPLSIPEKPLKTWSLDFMSDVLTNKRKFRTLNIIDDFNRRAIAIEVAHSMPASKVTYLLERIIKEQGKPSRFRTDNGPEFISREFRDWCADKEIEIQYIQPGRPMQNAYIERFNRPFGKVSWMPTSLKTLYKYRYSQKSGYRITTTKDHMNHWEEKHQWNTTPCRRHVINRSTLKKIDLLITTIFIFENSPGCQSENREGYKTIPC